MNHTTGGACPLCGAPYTHGGIHGFGHCKAQLTYQTYETYETYERGTGLTEADIRRIVREKLQRAKEPSDG